MSISKKTPTDQLIEEKMEAPHYDRGITPAETAARQDREGDAFMHIPTESDLEDDKTEPHVNPDSIHSMDGYTVDKEGLVNNYAIEPEMYINEPGDLREKEKAIAHDRAEILKELSENSKESKKPINEGDSCNS